MFFFNHNSSTGYICASTNKYLIISLYQITDLYSYTDSTWALLLLSMNDLIWGKEGNRLSLNLKIAFQFTSFIKNVVERKLIRAQIIRYWRAAAQPLKEINHADHNYHREYWLDASPAFSPEGEESSKWLFPMMHRFNMDLFFVVMWRDWMEIGCTHCCQCEVQS